MNSSHTKAYVIHKSSEIQVLHRISVKCQIDSQNKYLNYYDEENGRVIKFNQKVLKTLKKNKEEHSYFFENYPFKETIV